MSRLGIATRLWLLVALLLAAMAVTAGHGAYELRAAHARNGENLHQMRELMDAQDAVRTKQVALDAEATAALETLRRRAHEEEARLVADSAAAARRVALVQGSVFLLVLAIAVVLARLLVASVRRPIREVVLAAMRIAEGDLAASVRVYGQDETSRLMGAIAAMTEKLRSLVTEVTQRAQVVADSSAQVAQGNLDLSQRTEEQASTLEETASQMEELTATVAQNADNARRASQHAAEAAGLAGRGGEVVSQVVSTMGRISESSGRIADIIAVIDGISFQTNILALNAAVEAARAGEQGRGFAVVASEVRALAQRSATAAREIRDLIATSGEQVASGAQLVDEAGRTIVQVVEAVREVSGRVAEIAAASEEQSSGVAQVNTAVTQMDQVVQQNAALVEQATAATDSMREQAQALLDVVGRFRLGDAAEAVEVLPASPSAFTAGRLPFQRA
jgi:methyl-accepting chemotaxis protein